MRLMAIVLVGFYWLQVGHFACLCEWGVWSIYSGIKGLQINWINTKKQFKYKYQKRQPLYVVRAAVSLKLN